MNARSRNYSNDLTSKYEYNDIFENVLPVIISVKSAPWLKERWYEEPVVAPTYDI